MQRDDPDRYRDRLMIERIASRLGFDWLAARLPGDVYPPYVLVAVALVVQFGVVDGYNFFVTGRSTVLDNPTSVITGLGLILAVAGSRWMRDSYAEAVADLRPSERDGTVGETGDAGKPLPEAFRSIVPVRVTLAFLVIGYLAFFGNAVVLLGIDTLVEIRGVVGTILRDFIVLPAVVVPAMIEFGVLYLGIHVGLPRKIAAADLDLFYYDPRDMGGFAAVGQLLKRSYYLLTVGLLLYFFLVYGPVILSGILPTPFPEPEAPILVMFTVLWFAGVASIAYSMYRIHTVMARKKAATIREIEDEIREILDDPYDINTAHIADHDRREAIEHRLQQVRATKEYPSTFTMWSQILISVLLPQALQLAVQVAP